MDDDAATLLTQLLTDERRSNRIQEWIEHQYDFVTTEAIDRPDSPLLPANYDDFPLVDQPQVLPEPPVPDYDALFFPAPPSPDEHFERRDEKERARALCFLMQEMTVWRANKVSPSLYSTSMVPPSLAQTPAPRSRSSSIGMSRLPSIASALHPPSPTSSSSLATRTAITTPATSPSSLCFSPSTTVLPLGSDRSSLDPASVALPLSPTEERFDIPLLQRSQSHWSLASTASATPSEKRRVDEPKTPKRRTRLRSFISKFSPKSDSDMSQQPGSPTKKPSQSSLSALGYDRTSRQSMTLTINSITPTSPTPSGPLTPPAVKRMGSVEWRSGFPSPVLGSVPTGATGSVDSRRSFTSYRPDSIPPVPPLPPSLPLSPSHSTANLTASAQIPRPNPRPSLSLRPSPRPSFSNAPVRPSLSLSNLLSKRMAALPIRSADQDSDDEDYGRAIEDELDECDRETECNTEEGDELGLVSPYSPLHTPTSACPPTPLIPGIPLTRTKSSRSLKSIKSVKSMKSTKSTKSTFARVLGRKSTMGAPPMPLFGMGAPSVLGSAKEVSFSPSRSTSTSTEKPPLTKHQSMRELSVSTSLSPSLPPSAFPSTLRDTSRDSSRGKPGPGMRLLSAIGMGRRARAVSTSQSTSPHPTSAHSTSGPTSPSPHSHSQAEGGATVKGRSRAGSLVSTIGISMGMSIGTGMGMGTTKVYEVAEPEERGKTIVVTPLGESGAGEELLAHVRKWAETHGAVSSLALSPFPASRPKVAVSVEFESWEVAEWVGGPRPAGLVEEEMEDGDEGRWVEGVGRVRVGWA